MISCQTKITLFGRGRFAIIVKINNWCVLWPLLWRQYVGLHSDFFRGCKPAQSKKRRPKLWNPPVTVKTINIHFHEYKGGSSKTCWFRRGTCQAPKHRQTQVLQWRTRRTPCINRGTWTTCWVWWGTPGPIERPRELQWDACQTPWVKGRYLLTLSPRIGLRLAIGVAIRRHFSRRSN